MKKAIKKIAKIAMICLVCILGALTLLFVIEYAKIEWEAYQARREIQRALAQPSPFDIIDATRR